MSDLYLGPNDKAEALGDNPEANFYRTEDGYLGISLISEFGECELEFDPSEITAIKDYLATEFAHL